MHQSEPAERRDRDPQDVRRNFPLKLTLRQRALLDHEAARQGRPKNSILIDELAAFFADLERRHRQKLPEPRPPE